MNGVAATGFGAAGATTGLAATAAPLPAPGGGGRIPTWYFFTGALEPPGGGGPGPNRTDNVNDENVLRRSAYRLESRPFEASLMHARGGPNSMEIDSTDLLDRRADGSSATLLPTGRWAGMAGTVGCLSSSRPPSACASSRQSRRVWWCSSVYSRTRRWRCSPAVAAAARSTPGEHDRHCRRPGGRTASHEPGTDSTSELRDLTV